MKWIGLVVLLICLGCTSGEIKTPRDSGAEFLSDQSKADSLVVVDTARLAEIKVLERVKVLQDQFGKITLYAILDDTLLVTSDAPLKIKAGKMIPGNKFGLITPKTVLLNNEWDKIYNPDDLSPCYIEIESNKKVGLLNYKSGKIIPCQFDFMMPSDGKAIAIGKKDEMFYEIFEDKIIPIKKGFSYSKTLKNNPFNAFANKVFFNVVVDEDELYFGNAVYFTPSFWNVLKILPEVLNNLVDADYIEYGTDKSEMALTEIKSNGGFTSFIADFVERGIEGRGYEINKTHILSVSDNGHLKGQSLALESCDGGDFNLCESKNLSVKLINDTLVEIKKAVVSENIYDNYRTMEVYEYFALRKSGELVKIKSNRVFPFTAFVVLNDDYFKGCFSSYANEKKAFNGDVFLTDHLSVYDLELMKNEILASYGFIFEEDNWRAYFEEKSWYLAQNNKVDSLVNPIEEKNIDYILNKVEQLKESGDKLINKRLFVLENKSN